MKKIKMLLSLFLRPATIAPLPLGLTADKTAMYGLLGFQQNANTYSQTMTSTSSAGTAVAISAAALIGGVAQINTGASGGFTIDTPTGGAIVAALGATIPLDGTFQKIIRIVNNNVGQTGTLTGGSGVTVVGTATIATDTKREFLMRVMNSATITLTNIGSLSL